jgi:lipoprotein-anchoring transpeptidase ErfK/SrfK
MRFGFAGAVVAGVLAAAPALAEEPVKVVNGAVKAQAASETKPAETKVAALPADADAERSASAAEVTEPDRKASKKAQTSRQAALAPVTRAPQKASPAVRAVINLSTQRMSVSVNGALVHTWKISSGRAGYHTPRGTFRPNWLSRMHYSRQYDGAPMPYSVFFNRGIATHGTNAVSRLGRPASHGCIRLRTSNARTFYNLVRKYGKSRVRIVVQGTTPRSSTPVARRSRPSRSARNVARQRRASLSRDPYTQEPWWREAARSQRNAYRAPARRQRVQRARQTQRQVYRRRTYRQTYVRRPAAARRPFFGRPRGRLVFPGDRR